ncbi:MAG: hypothetical protein JAY67_20915, partial [Candidatus Thiodiazotropha taylori]|nr:hypothetical protein [Candidatus Thiodiazotropha taylori]
RYATLIAKNERTAGEEQVIREHREQLTEALVRGGTPQEQVLREAMSEFSLQRAIARPSERKELKEAKVKEILDIWASIDAEDTGS